MQAIDKAALTPLVRKALDNPTLTVVNWDSQPVGGGVGGARFDTFIYRLTGQADDQGVEFPWSLIVKILTARAGEQPADPQYWRRETEAYRSGLLDDLPGSVFAPRCFEVEEYPGESCWIWLEDLHDEIGQQWPMEHYGVAARYLGQFNGAYLVGRPLPAESWLSSGWFRKMAMQVAPNIPNVQHALTVPLLKAVFPSDASEQYSRLWSERDVFLNALDSLPQCFCHLDAVRRNLVTRRGVDKEWETVAIDWAYAGISAVGAEIAVCLMIALLFCEIDAKDAPQLETILFDSYLIGLADAGWQGNPKQVRLGCSAAIVGKYLEIIHALPFLTDAGNAASIEQMMGLSLEQMAVQSAETFRFVQTRADEARMLVSRLE